MKGIVLDKIEENKSKCFLTKIILDDFVNSLSESYKEYEVQREIVTNTYLDNLIDTVLNKKHIPPIVLVVDKGHYSLKDNFIEIAEFKILDGLQRTFRLQLIWKTIELFKNEAKDNPDILSFSRLQLSRKYSAQLAAINSNSKILETIIKFHNQNNKDKSFDISTCLKTYQWFEIWTELSPREEVNKMLILNAGHKPVKTQHQLELLFLNLIPIIKQAGLESFELIREKESSSTVFSKNRIKGQFHFAHLIISIISLNQGRPATANIDLVHKAQSPDFDMEEYEKYFNYDFLHELIQVLLEFDDRLELNFKDLGTKWLGREVSMVGVFSAVGRYGKDNFIDPVELLAIFKNKIVRKAENLNLIEFENFRNNLDLSKINIGTVNKNAIHDAIYDELEGNDSKIDWSNYFL